MVSAEAFNLESWEVGDEEGFEIARVSWSRKSDGGGGISDGRGGGGLRVESDPVRDREEVWRRVETRLPVASVRDMTVWVKIFVS